MQRLVLFSLVLLTILPSCSWYGKKFGIKYRKPKPETSQTIEKNWLRTIPELQTFQIKKPDGNGIEDSVYKKNVTQYVTFFGEMLKGAIVFNKDGKRINLFEDKVCLGKTDNFFKAATSNSKFLIVENIDIEHFIKHINNADALREKIYQSQSKTDFFIILPWCNWIGLTKLNAKKWYKLAQKNTKAVFYFIPVNFDVREDWRDAQVITDGLELKTD
jgi:hypothetical protein